MISKRKALAGAAALVVFTALATYGLTVRAYRYTLSANRTLLALEQQPNFARFLQAITYARQYYVVQPDLNKMLEGAARGAIAALGDPYSAYFDESALTEAKIEAEGQYGGIGVSVDERDGWTVVVHVFPHTPAADTPFEGAGPSDPRGLRPGDRFLRVDGKSLQGIPVDDVAKLIRGARDTPLALTVVRSLPGGGERQLTFRLLRRIIIIPTAEGRMIGPYGYLHITGFNEQTPDQVESALQNLRQAGMKALVLDLRDNPGGLLASAVGVAGDFLPPGVVTYLVDRSGRRTPYEVQKSHPLGVPFVVLVNRGTASAAELLAGAIQDRKAAPLIGERTFGKFVVQRIWRFPGGTAGVKLTTDRYLTPSGRYLNLQGLSPDIPVAYPQGADPSLFGDPQRDPQLRTALQILAERA